MTLRHSRFDNFKETLEKEQRALKERQHRTQLWNGLELQYHIPTRSQTLFLNLADSIPENFRHSPLEVEIGPGKGEFLAQRALKHPDRFFIGIDRRQDRALLSSKKLEKNAQANWIILREDACSFDTQTLPCLDVFHLYQPDPWPKFRHHKHRFFRSPEAKAFAHALKIDGELRLSTDHLGYFLEMIDLVKTWNIFELVALYEKTNSMSEPMTHFESLFLKKNETVFKAIFRKSA
jgi:tRNA (guanine-N7-)-methyltransferase